MKNVYLLALFATLVLPAFAGAQPRIAVDDVACLPVGDNGIVTATVSGEPGGSTVRYYFRRLHEEVEDFYYVDMVPQGGGKYWSPLPQAADETLDVMELERELAEERADAERILDELGEEAEENPQAAWWVVKERTEYRDPNDDLNTEIIEERAQNGRLQRRDWMLEMPLDELETWLDELENEPTEVYATVLDANGREIARSTMEVIEVTEDCDVQLDERQRGRANNLVVGETAPWEIGRRVFHWQCDGIISRLDYRGVLRSDEICRACVVAWLEDEGTIVAATAGVIGVIGIVIDGEPQAEPVSPSEP
jgi:hypothetical protein